VVTSADGPRTGPGRGCQARGRQRRWRRPRLLRESSTSGSRREDFSDSRSVYFRFRYFFGSPIAWAFSDSFMKVDE